MSTISNYNNAQDYAKIKRQHSNENRFTDSQFLPCNASIGSKDFLTRNKSFLTRGSDLVKWERAKVRT